MKLSRVTLATRDMLETITLASNGPARRNFDLVAIQPLSQSVLEAVSLFLSAVFRGVKGDGTSDGNLYWAGD